VVRGRIVRLLPRADSLPLGLALAWASARNLPLRPLARPAEGVPSVLRHGPGARLRRAGLADHGR